MYPPNSSSLLILPPPPSPPTLSALKAAYHPSLTASLTTLASLKLSKPVILQIALPCTGKENLKKPMSCLFHRIEQLLAGMYSLISIVCTQNSIGLDSDGGVDSRVLLVAYDEPFLAENDHDSSSPLAFLSGPLVDMQLFALTRRSWNCIFSPDSQQGQQILSHYLGSTSSVTHPVKGQFHKVPGGIYLSTKAMVERTSTNESTAIHKTVAVGGTFDHLHAGHKLLLTATALLLQPCTPSSSDQRRLIIGITGDELLKNKKYAEQIKGWKQRQEDVVDFLLTILSFSQHGGGEPETISINEPTVNGRGVLTRLNEAHLTIECIEIQDPFGPTITDETITALIVSRETRSGGAAVNTKREEKGWKSLEVFEVSVLGAQDEKSSAIGTEEFAAKISSTAIRKQKAEMARKASL